MPLSDFFKAYAGLFEMEIQPVSDIDIKKVDHAFIMEYEFYLRSERKCANNSAVKYIKNFGKIIRICIANRWLTYDPFLNYKNKIKTVDRVFLTVMNYRP